MVRGWSFTAFRPETFATANAPLTKKDKGNRIGFTADWPQAPGDVPTDYHSADCVRIPKPRGRHSTSLHKPSADSSSISSNTDSSSSGSSTGGIALKEGEEQGFDDDDFPLEDDATKFKAQAFAAAAQAESAVKAARAARAAAEASANVLAPLAPEGDGGERRVGGEVDEAGIPAESRVAYQEEENSESMVHGMRRLLVNTLSTGSSVSNAYQEGGNTIVGHGSPHVAWSDGSSEAHYEQQQVNHRSSETNQNMNHGQEMERAKTLEELEAESRKAQQEAEEREEVWRWAQEAKKAKEAADARGKVWTNCWMITSALLYFSDTVN